MLKVAQDLGPDQAVAYLTPLQGGFEVIGVLENHKRRDRLEMDCVCNVCQLEVDHLERLDRGLQPLQGMPGAARAIADGSLQRVCSKPEKLMSWGEGVISLGSLIYMGR